MTVKRLLFLQVLIAMLASMAFLRCEREDLYGISAAKFSFSNNLKAQYQMPGATGFRDVSYSGVNWGNVEVTPAPIFFQLVNTSSSDITILELGIENASTNFTYATFTETIAAGATGSTFTVNFAATAAGSYSAQMYIKFYQGTDTTRENEISFTLKAVKPTVSGGLVAQFETAGVGTGYVNVSGTIDLGTALMAVGISRTVRLMNTSAEMIMASTPSVSDPQFTVSAVTGINAGGYADITVQLTSALIGIYDCSVTIEYQFTSDPGNYKQLVFDMTGELY